ncbi:hypothetical protein CALCODRAFT_514038 [Calocera cornea HHB12733]|uniref:F-box domain-containing protein n=1 Tax=Calocera cornea HHB12733 TaxID=1353952 RepID=A0A165K0N3_9BASI|nr:hypothetical protein CALCODRAFT_514038 [Calocera cornea HHB12733]
MPALAQLTGDDGLFQPDMFNIISASERLVELSAEISNCSVPRLDLLPEPRSECFLHLKKLVLDASLANIKALFHQLGACLESLHITSSCKRIDFKDIQDLIPNQARWLTRNLESFYFVLVETERDVVKWAPYEAGLDDVWVKIREGLPRPTAPAPVLWRVFWPLSKCNGMLHFTIRFLSWNHLKLDDQEIRTMSGQWELLQTLDIAWERRTHVGFDVSGLVAESQLTLACLKELAEKCKYLRAVRLTHVDGSQALPGREEMKHLRRELPVEVDVGYASFGLGDGEGNERARAREVASYLYALWPKMTLRWHEDNRHSLRWKMVANELVTLAWDL